MAKAFNTRQDRPMPTPYPALPPLSLTLCVSFGYATPRTLMEADGPPLRQTPRRRYTGRGTGRVRFLGLVQGAFVLSGGVLDDFRQARRLPITSGTALPRVNATFEGSEKDCSKKERKRGV